MIVITEGEVNKIEVISEEDEEIEYCAQDVQDIIWIYISIFRFNTTKYTVWYRYKMRTPQTNYKLKT